ncbi:MAG: hypothetical protein GVY29_00340 [Spirochaetes bacterium]|jgi:hypothetical protein|nr:hypothetical protein [Spirochaetota bacterium]
MNRIRRTFAIVGALLALVAVGSFAQQTTDTGTLGLTGTVPKIVSITVADEAIASNLDLTTDVSSLLVATVTERSNVQAGYTVTVESANAAAAGTGSGFFDSSDAGNNDTLNYSVTYGGNAVSYSSGAPATVTDAGDKTASSGDSNEVRISYSGSSANIYNGTYSDTLTFTITAK